MHYSRIIILGLALAWAVAPAYADNNYTDPIAPPAVSAAGGALAGHDGGGFFLQSGDGNFVMRPFGLLQIRSMATFRDDSDDDVEMGVEFRRIELGFKGNIYTPKLGYVLVLATEGGSAIIAQDVQVSYQMPNGATWRWAATSPRSCAKNSLEVAVRYRLLCRT